MVNDGDDPIEEVVNVEQATGFYMKSELCPREDFKEFIKRAESSRYCLLYTSDAADE